MKGEDTMAMNTATATKVTTYFVGYYTYLNRRNVVSNPIYRNGKALKFASWDEANKARQALQPRYKHLLFVMNFGF